MKNNTIWLIPFVVVIVVLLFCILWIIRWTTALNNCQDNGGEFAKHWMEWKCYY